MRAGSLTASGLVVSRDSQLVLDVEEDALLAVEEALADLGPPADVLDREEAGRADESNSVSTPSTTGRQPLEAKTLGPRACRGSRGTPGLPRGFRRVMIAAGFSIRIVSSGTTYSIGCPACWAKIASFS